MLDDAQLVVDGAPCTSAQREVFARDRPLAVPAATPLLGEHTQVRHLVERPTVGAGRAREGWKARRHEREVERGRTTDGRSGCDGSRIAGEAALLLGAAAQVGHSRSGEPRVEIVEAPTGTDRGDGGGESTLRRRGVVHVVGGDTGEVVTGGEFGEGVVAHGIDRVAVVPEFDDHSLAPEQPDQPPQFTSSGLRALGREGGRHRSLAAPREHPRMTRHCIGEIVEPEDGHTLLAGEMAEAEGPGDPCVPLGAVGEQQHVRPVRVGGMGVGQQTGVDLVQGLGLRSTPAFTLDQTGRERDLGPEHRGQPDRTGCLGEADHPVEPVVIGEGEGVETEPDGLLDELLGVRRPVEEREVAVAVQFGIGDMPVAAGTSGGCRGVAPCGGGGVEPSGWRLVGLSTTSERRAVTSSVRGGRARGAPVATP